MGAEVGVACLGYVIALVSLLPAGTINQRLMVLSMGISLVPRLFPPPVFDLVSFPDPPEKQERDWCSERHFLSHGVAPHAVKNDII